MYVVVPRLKKTVAVVHAGSAVAFSNVNSIRNLRMNEHDGVGRDRDRKGSDLSLSSLGDSSSELFDLVMGVCR